MALMLQLYKNIDNNEDRSSLATFGFSILQNLKLGDCSITTQ